MKTSWNQGLYRPEFEHDNCGIGAVVNMKGKKKRVGQHVGRTSDWKKAIVTLTEDSKAIEFFEGM